MFCSVNNKEEIRELKNALCTSIAFLMLFTDCSKNREINKTQIDSLRTTADTITNSEHTILHPITGLPTELNAFVNQIRLLVVDKGWNKFSELYSSDSVMVISEVCNEKPDRNIILKSDSTKFYKNILIDLDSNAISEVEQNGNYLKIRIWSSKIPFKDQHLNIISQDGKYVIRKSDQYIFESYEYFSLLTFVLKNGKFQLFEVLVGC